MEMFDSNFLQGVPSKSIEELRSELMSMYHNPTQGNSRPLAIAIDLLFYLDQTNYQKEVLKDKNKQVLIALPKWIQKFLRG